MSTLNLDSDDVVNFARSNFSKFPYAESAELEGQLVEAKLLEDGKCRGEFAINLLITKSNLASVPVGSKCGRTFNTRCDFDNQTKQAIQDIRDFLIAVAEHEGDPKEYRTATADRDDLIAAGKAGTLVGMNIRLRASHVVETYTRKKGPKAGTQGYSATTHWTRLP